MTLSGTPLRAMGGTFEEAASAIGTIEARATTASASAWDAAAQRCDASFRCAHRGSRAWQFEKHVLHRLRRLDLFAETADGRVKVGQCAVGVGRRRSVFSDSIQLLPEHAHRWTAAMSSVLRVLGPAVYEYGSPWSLEVPRESLLRKINGVTVEDVATTAVDAIDFNRWPSFETYRRAISENVRRNMKKAPNAYPGLKIDSGGPRRYVESLLMRRALFQRKRLGRSTANMVVRSVARVWSVGQHGQLAYLANGGRLLGYHMGIGFGRDWSYLESATCESASGEAWYLLMHMIERAWRRSDGRGRFVMGSDDGTMTDGAWEGLRRSRRQCCATPFPTSIVRFRYTGT